MPLTDKQKADKVKRLALRKKWQARREDNRHHSGKVYFDTTNLPDSPFKQLLEGLFNGALDGLKEALNSEVAPAAPFDPEALFCSFCGNKVERSRATFGTNPRISKVQELTEVEGHIIIEETIRFRQNQLVACPNCVLKIKPSVAKEPCGSCGGVDSTGCKVCKGKGKVDGRVTSRIKFVSREEC